MILLRSPGEAAVAVALFVLLTLTCVSALVAVLHPKRRRRDDAFRVLALLIELVRRRGDQR